MKQTCIVFWFLYCLLNQTVLTNAILALIKSFSFNKYAQGTEYMLDTCVGGHILYFVGTITVVVQLAHSLFLT